MSELLKISLPDGSVREMPEGSTPADVAAAIGPGLAKAALAARVNGELRDLTRPGVRFVNRPPDSGTRVLLQGLLRAQGIEEAAIGGYERCETTHAAVAALLASGLADVGFGLEAAARQPGKVVRNTGDIDKAIGSAASTLEASYYLPHLAQAPMEPMVAVARFKDGQCEAWAPSQAPQVTRERVAERLGIPFDKVTVHITLLGGGFGRKSKPDFVIEAALIAREVGKPVVAQELPAGAQALLDARAQARTDKDWAASDSLRDELAILGVVVADSKDGQSWSLT